MPAASHQGGWNTNQRRCSTAGRAETGTMSMDPQSPVLGGLEPAVAVRGDELTGQALARLRQAGARLAVIVDAHDNPQKVMPEKTLAAAPPGQQATACKPAWPAATFIQPASAADAQRLAAHNQSQPWFGHRTVVIENGRIAGVVPLPALLNRPGPTTRALERVFWHTGILLARVRYRRTSQSPHPG
jgi:hypothetical protein